MSAPEQSQATSRQVGTERRALLATCVAAAVRAAEVLRARAEQRHDLVWEEKAHVDFVSEADRAAERAIAEVIGTRHPNAVVAGEELSPKALASDARGLAFVVDPLDGTTNYLHGYPWFAVSIAALVDGEPIAGAVLNVPSGELFTAIAGGGARRNGQPITVSPITDPLRALVGTGFPFKKREQVDGYLRVFADVMRQTAGIRRAGAAALDLADVACGRFEAFWELTLAPWDVAAGMLLVREAGGVVTDVQGRPATVGHTSIVAGNPALHAWLLEKVRFGVEV
jgi:myo-inositol-1(or 4)-monophosphatase